jgi:hypothetical protein
MLLASASPELKETSGTRGNKNTKRLTRADSVIYECFTLQCFVYSIIQKIIHVKAEKLLSGCDHSEIKWVFSFMRNNAQDQSKTRYSIPGDLHILV